MWCRGLFSRLAWAHVLVVAVGLIAEPAGACERMPPEEITAGPQPVPRYLLEDRMTRPLLDLWRERSRTAISPDTVVLLAPVGEPYLIAFEREGCLLGLLPVPRGSFHRVLAIRLGKVA